MGSRRLLDVAVGVDVPPVSREAAVQQRGQLLRVLVGAAGFGKAHPGTNGLSCACGLGGTSSGWPPVAPHPSTSKRPGEFRPVPRHQDGRLKDEPFNRAPRSIPLRSQ